jgi:aspartate/methionine/tyrosine aminotransferase
MRLSGRIPGEAPVNALTRSLDALRASGQAVIDLTESNPTHVDLAYPSRLLAPLAEPRGLRYEPQPLGLASARQAIAGDALRRGFTIDAADVVVTASTSESYSWLFKLLCDPGDTVLVPAPSYPLFEFLARAEGVRLATYDLRFDGRWEVDVASMAAAPSSCRAVVVVSPNNPTGSYIRAGEADAVWALCAARGWALIADEVFADYALDEADPFTDLAARAPVLTFSLGGASKSLGLPQIKLGWITLGGPPAERRTALDALELVADTFLSVATPVQLAAAELLRDGAHVREAIRHRVLHNLGRARALVAAFPACSLLPVEGGWTAVVRVPGLRTEESLVLELLERERILVHPGYFFDFQHEAYLVVSLLPAPGTFADAFERVLRHASSAP